MGGGSSLRLSTTTTIILAVAALLTSIVSGILGMAGGIMLLATMLCFMSHAEAVPIHAAVQIPSNGTRALAFISSVDRRALSLFVVGVIPGGVVGAAVLWAIGPAKESEPWLKMLIGAYILFATFVLRKRKGGEKKPERSLARNFITVGFFAGSAALTVGAVGPLIAPTFARLDFVKERLIATKATCQLCTHVMKIPAFLLLRDLDVTRLGVTAVIMMLVVIPGTLIGKRILKFVPEAGFRKAYMVALALAGTKVLVFDGLMNLPFFAAR